MSAHKKNFKVFLFFSHLLIYNGSLLEVVYMYEHLLSINMYRMSLMLHCTRKDSSQITQLRNKSPKTNNEYAFTKVFGIDINNEEIHQTLCMPMIDSVLEGYNYILNAYGQTGAGKTFTMLGKPKLGVIGLQIRAVRRGSLQTPRGQNRIVRLIFAPQSDAGVEG